VDMNWIQMNSYPNADGPSAAYSCFNLLISVALIVLIMQNDDRDQIKKTISEYREAFFAAMLNKHYTHAALYMKCMIACVPSESKLGAIEAPEANPISSNENATDYAKRLFKWIDNTLPIIERKMADAI
jgi:hypothetical protein